MLAGERVVVVFFFIGTAESQVQSFYGPPVCQWAAMLARQEVEVSNTGRTGAQPARAVWQQTVTGCSGKLNWDKQPYYLFACVDKL